MPGKACTLRCKDGMLETFRLSVAEVAHLNGSLGHEASYVSGTIHPDWPTCSLLLPAHMHTIHMSVNLFQHVLPHLLAVKPFQSCLPADCTYLWPQCMSTPAV